MHKNAARNFQRHVVSQTEEMSVGNHKEFWTQLEALGPRKVSSIPLKVRVGNEIITDENEVINRWCEDFCNLYKQHGTTGQYDDDFLNQVKEENIRIGSNMSHANFQSNLVLNRKISFYEIERVVLKLKTQKAPGPDMIPNELVKCSEIRLLLYHLFNYCFEHGIVPSRWLKAIIKPIPKGANKDPYAPWNFLGIR